MLRRLLDMRVSASSLIRLTTRSGTVLEGIEEAALEELRSCEEIPASATSATVSLDGVMVPVLEGRAAGWREASCGTVAFQDELGAPVGAPIMFGRMPESGKGSLKSRLRSEVEHIALMRPDIVRVAVADGAADNWTFLSELASDGPQMVDFFHAAQHLHEVSEDVYGTGTKRAKAWYEKQRHVLRHEHKGVEKVIRSLRHHGKRSAVAKRDAGYFSKHRWRMQYRLWRAIRSARAAWRRRTRFWFRKRAGQRWGAEGGQAVLSFRALVKSERFDAMWPKLVKCLQAANDNAQSRLMQELEAA